MVLFPVTLAPRRLLRTLNHPNFYISRRLSYPRDYIEE